MGAFRTFPDWNVTPGQLPSPDSDMAELAARTGSPAAYHRDGRVIWFDDFENGLGGWKVTAGNAYAFSIYPYRGAGCMRLVPPAGPIFFSAQVERQMPPMVTRKTGLEMFMSCETGFEHGYFGITFETSRTGGNHRRVTVVLDYKGQGPGNDLYIFNAGVNLIGPIQGPVGGTLYTNVKAIFDVETFSVVRVFINDEMIPIDLPFLNVGVGVDTFVRVELVWHDFDLLGRPARVDDFIITVDEA